MLNRDRISKVQARMREQGIQAYMILTHDDYLYLMGEDRYQPRAIIPAVGDPIVITFKGEEEEVRQNFKLDEVKVFSTVGQQIKDVVGSMRNLFQHVGQDGKIKVGVQMGFFTPAFLLTMFQKANPVIEVVDIAPVMDELRMVKDNNELELMRKVCRIADIGMEAAVKALKPGITENLVAAEIEYAMRKAGGHGTAVPVFVNSGVRSGWLHGMATDRVIEAGSPVVIDIVPKHFGYCANLCRTFVMGEPSQKHQEMYDTYKNAQEAAANFMKPGIQNRQIDDIAKTFFDEKGYGNYFIHGFSHSIGLMFEESPMPTIHPAHAAIELKADMTLTSGHSVLSVPGIGGVRIEDTYHLTQDGAIPLTQFPKCLGIPV